MDKYCTKRHAKFGLLAAVIVFALLLPHPGPALSNQAAKITEHEAYEIGIEAYIYLYPIVLMDVSRRNHINYEVGQKQGLGPMNMFHNMRTYQAVEDRDVVRPNFDTLYSRAWSTSRMVL